MPRPLKVYGWTGWRRECPPAPNGSRQTRDVVAARSMVEVARIVGVKGPWNLFCLCETRNEREIEVAMASPGTVYWKPLDAWNGSWKASRKGVRY